MRQWGRDWKELQGVWVLDLDLDLVGDGRRGNNEGDILSLETFKLFIEK